MEQQLGPSSALPYPTLLTTIHNWNTPFRLQQKYDVWSLRPVRPISSLALTHPALPSLLSANLDAVAGAPPDRLLLSRALPVHEEALPGNLHHEISEQALVRPQPHRHSQTNLLFSGQSCHRTADQPGTIGQNLLRSHRKLVRQLNHYPGLKVQGKAYALLLKNYQKKGSSNVSRKQSVDKDAPPTILTLTQKKSTFQSMRRRNGHGDLERSLHSTKKHIPLDDMKSQLRQNLYVKPHKKPKKIKYPLRELQVRMDKQTRIPSSPAKSTVAEREQSPKKIGIQSTQLSEAALSLNKDLRLSEVKAFTIHCTSGKSAVSLKGYRGSLDKQNKKEKKEEKISTAEGCDLKVSRKDWGRMVTQMKEKLYQGKKKKCLKGQQNELEDESMLPPIRHSSQTLFEQRYRQCFPVMRDPRVYGGGEERMLAGPGLKALDIANSPNLVIDDRGKRDSKLLKLRL